MAVATNWDLSVGVTIIRAILFGVQVRAPGLGVPIYRSPQNIEEVPGGLVSPKPGLLWRVMNKVRCACRIRNPGKPLTLAI